MTKHKIYTMSVASVYPHYVTKAEKKGHTKTEVDEIIRWLTGWSQEALEAQLRADIGRVPASAPLHLMLGNLYSAQGRWSEAQAAYYEAHRLDPGSPEIAHNLAVSLDRLGQSSLAARFYRRALEGANARSTSLDTAAVARRLAEIE